MTDNSDDSILIWSFEDSPSGKAIFSLLNGSEPQYEPSKWNDDIKIKKTHNCYAYMFDIINTNFEKKPQPGYAAGYSYLSDSEIRKCDTMFQRIKADNPSVIPSDFESPCPSGYRKGYMAVDDGEDTDYHFYRLDNDGYWSHKPGSTEVLRANTNGLRIKAPHLAERRGSSHHYKKSCGYFCFNPKKTVISNKPKPGEN